MPKVKVSSTILIIKAPIVQFHIPIKFQKANFKTINKIGSFYTSGDKPPPLSKIRHLVGRTYILCFFPLILFYPVNLRPIILFVFSLFFRAFVIDFPSVANFYIYSSLFSRFFFDLFPIL